MSLSRRPIVTSVHPRTIAEIRKRYPDDPVLAALTDDQVDALAKVIVRLAASTARRLAEARADAILAEIPDAEFDAFAEAALGVLLSANRNRGLRNDDEADR
jgi:hypothetical protein